MLCLVIMGFRLLNQYGLRAAQIEAMRVTISRKLKKVGKMFLRVFPDKPVSKKPAETRMGKGKGNVEFWVSVVKRDRIVCEVSGLSEIEAKEVLKQAQYKLPMKTKIVKREAVIQPVIETNEVAHEKQ